MRKIKINYGLIAFGIAFLLVVGHIVGYCVFYKTETKQIEADIAAELQTKYGLTFDKLQTDEIDFENQKKATLSVTLTEDPDSDNEFTFDSNYYSLQIEKKDGKWTITKSESEITAEDQETEAEEVIFWENEV